MATKWVDTFSGKAKKVKTAFLQGGSGKGNISEFGKVGTGCGERCLASMLKRLYRLTERTPPNVPMVMLGFRGIGPWIGLIHVEAVRAVCHMPVYLIVYTNGV